MTFTLPDDALGKLPAPDSQGLVRGSATVRVKGNGECELLEFNNSPVGSKKDADEEVKEFKPPEMPADLY